MKIFKWLHFLSNNSCKIRKKRLTCLKPLYIWQISCLVNFVASSKSLSWTDFLLRNASLWVTASCMSNNPKFSDTSSPPPAALQAPSSTAPPHLKNRTSLPNYHDYFGFAIPIEYLSCLCENHNAYFNFTELSSKRSFQITVAL